MFGTFIGCISGYRIYTILNQRKLYHVDNSQRLISISSDPFSSTLVNDRRLIDWNIPATMFSFHVESTVCDYSKRIYLQCSCYFALVTTHSIHLTSNKLITRSTVSKRESDTRNSQMLNVPLFRTATGQKTIYYRTVYIWNNLNNDIKLCIDVNSFRSKLRGVLLDKFKREEWYPNDLQL